MTTQLESFCSSRLVRHRRTELLATNNLFKTTPTRPCRCVRFLCTNGDAERGLQRVANEQRYGINVEYDGARQTFSFSSGTTGDTSQIDVNFSVPTFDATTGVPTGAVDAQGDKTLQTNLPAAAFMWVFGGH